MSVRYVSLADEAQLALSGAQQRLARAQQALRDFQLEHDGQAVSSELRASLERERHLLDVELDEAERQCRKARKDFAEAKTS
jgi:hypothetical protein